LSSSNPSPLHNFSAVLVLNDTSTTATYTLSLHDALPIFVIQAEPAEGIVERLLRGGVVAVAVRIFQAKKELPAVKAGEQPAIERDRKSTRLNSSHGSISYAVFCLKKKNREPYEQGRHPTK